VKAELDYFSIIHSCVPVIQQNQSNHWHDNVLQFPVRKVQWFINQQKDEGIRPNDIEAGHNYFVKKSLEVLLRAEICLSRMGA
jgi:hypothetical protein